MTTFKEIFKDVLPIIEKAAPSIGAIIGGPAGIATTFIINMLAKTFDAKPDDVKHIADCIMCDPSAELKLKQLEQYNQDLLATIKKEKEDNKPSNIEINITMK
jgi:hypothetical protein